MNARWNKQSGLFVQEEASVSILMDHTHACVVKDIFTYKQILRIRVGVSFHVNALSLNNEISCCKLHSYSIANLSRV